MALGVAKAERIGWDAAALIGAAGVILEAVRIQRDSARKFVRSAVELVRTTLERYVYDPTGGLPVLRIVGVGLNLELLHRVHRWHQRDVVVPGLPVVGCAVQQELVVTVIAAVNVPVGDRAVV